MSIDKSISFIIPIYNCAAYLRDCINSIISDKSVKKEVILINDGSTDESLTICNEYAAQHDFIHVINQENMGTSSARNRGIEYAKGDYIWFVDSDDMINSTNFPKIASYLEHNPQIICFNYTEHTSSSDLQKKYFIQNEEYSAISFLEKNAPGYLWNKVFRKDIIGNTRFLEGTKNIEDFLFCIEVISKATTIVCLSDIGYTYNCTNQTSTSRNRSRENLMKLSSDSFRIHTELNQFIQGHMGRLKTVLSSILYVSIAGHLRSLLINYDRFELLTAIKSYKGISLYPLKYTKNRKANLFILIANITPVIYAIAYLYDMIKGRYRD